MPLSSRSIRDSIVNMYIGVCILHMQEHGPARSTTPDYSVNKSQQTTGRTSLLGYNRSLRRRDDCSPERRKSPSYFRTPPRGENTIFQFLPKTNFFIPTKLKAS